METKRKVAASLIVIIMLISVFSGCAKDSSTGKTIFSDENTTLKAEETTLISKETDPELSKVANAKVGDIVQFGEYEQDNNTANGKEKINWRVLAVDNGKAFLLSEKILDCRSYNETDMDVTWETCTLRTWLNNDFYNVIFTKWNK